MEGLRSLQVETHSIHDILKLNVQPSDSDYAVDIRNSAINVRTLVNTFEKHPSAQAVMKQHFSCMEFTSLFRVTVEAFIWTAASPADS